MPPLLMVVSAGFVAVIFSLALFYIFRAFDLTQFSPTIQLGGIFFRDPRHPAAETSGFVLLLVIGSTLVAAGYSLILEMLGGPTWAAGLAIGIVHGLLAAGSLPLFGTISASIRAGVVPAPGRFGIAWGWLTPIALAAGHGLYGGVFGAILQNL
jgi:hypothetical protein